jgi:hypothetical protein
MHTWSLSVCQSGKQWPPWSISFDMCICWHVAAIKDSVEEIFSKLKNKENLKEIVMCSREWRLHQR